VRLSDVFEPFVESIANHLSRQSIASQAALKDPILQWVKRIVDGVPAGRELSEVRMTAELGARGAVALLQLLRNELEALADEIAAEHSPLVRAALGRVFDRELAALLGVTAQRELQEPAALGSSRARALAHEVRNPLNGAVIHLTFLERQLAKLEADPETLQAVNIIGKEIQRVSELVNSYLETNQAQRKNRVSLRALCTRAVQLVARDAAALGIDIHTGAEPPDVALELDLSRIELVLLDLLQNAIEGALEHKGKVLMCAKHEAGNAVIEVRHDGGSVSYAPGVFEHAGGVGLNVALQVVAEQGGALDVQSSPTGTIFHLTLPIQGQRRVQHS
jgi:signal transduction histidine kinase